MIDPDHEEDAGVARDLEALLYAIAAADRDAATGRDFMILRGLLGAVMSREAASVGTELVMVPEGGGSDAIPLRPVARPVRVPEKEISGSKRVRLHAPARRYRLIWVGPDRLPCASSPTSRRIATTGASGSLPRHRSSPRICRSDPCSK